MVAIKSLRGATFLLIELILTHTVLSSSVGVCGDKMEPSPFNRRQWTSQSLKITAKELSLVNKNKSSALVERFSR